LPRASIHDWHDRAGRLRTGDRQRAGLRNLAVRSLTNGRQTGADAGTICGTGRNTRFFSGETADDPHLVLNLGAQVDQAPGNGQEPEPEVFRRFYACVEGSETASKCGFRAAARPWTSMSSRSGCGSDSSRRIVATRTLRHQSAMPTAWCSSYFVGYAREYCERHQLTELGNLWNSIEQADRRRRTSANGRGARHDSIL
jgi:hypothetical protein